MAKPIGPLMSMDASGTIGGTLTFSHWKGRCYVRQRVVPANPKSPLQLGIRGMQSFLSKAWKSIGAVAQASYDTLASASSISAFNAYMKANMDRWVLGEGPSMATPAAKTHAATTVSALTPTGGDNHVSLAITIAASTNQWGVALFRSDASITATDRSTLVAVIPVTGTSLTYLDSGLAAGTYHYRARAISDDGNLGTAIADTTATVT